MKRPMAQTAHHIKATAKSTVKDHGKDNAVVLLSGGLDSATCLAWAQQHFNCVAISFAYGQRHSSELVAASQIAQAAGVSHRIINIDIGQLGGSSLTDLSLSVPEGTDISTHSVHNTAIDDAIPSTYVPARNTVFLSYALALAEVTYANHIVIGVNAVDYSGYPDCRPEFIAAFETMANLATKAGVQGKKLTIETPLIQLTKAQIIQMGVGLGVNYALTVSCYQADAAGKACGRCDSCQLRQQGFRQANLPDPTVYQ